jgi:hypothetical protein
VSERVYTLTPDDDGFEDQDGTFWESRGAWLFTGILGGCGCGSSDEMRALAVEVLTLFATPHEARRWSVYDRTEAEVMAHWLDSKGLLEHGSSIAGSWLTDKGMAILALVSPQTDETEG